MNKLKRYCMNNHDTKMVENENGAFCNYSDIDAILPRWIPVSERLPDDDTTVEILWKGNRRIGELRWEHPSYEDNFKAYRFWDAPYDDGQDWEWNEVTHWLDNIPKAPARDGICQTET